MTSDQSSKLAYLYSELLRSRGVSSERLTAMVQPSAWDSLRHAHWMCQEVIRMADSPDPPAEKCNRWIGFIQGVLWSRGFRTVDQLREDVSSI